MRILVVGAGGTGGYFGGRLLETKQDVTFLVRPRRAAQLASIGLVIQSPAGDVTILQPPTVLAGDLHPEFDLILLSCKAYDLEGAITAFAPAVGAETAILPLLNGMRHLDVLDRRFGPARVLGGIAVISSALEAEGRILHLNDLHTLIFGERDGSRSARVEAIAVAFSGGRFVSRLSDVILQEMWEKWVFIATAASITCLMRATVGDIAAAGGAGLASTLLDECAGIAASQHFPPRPQVLQRSRAMLTASGSGLTASMLRDVERHGPIEADHILGDLLRRGEQGGIDTPLLRIAHAHLNAYELRRAREAAQETNPPLNQEVLIPT
jgi:2-dehydropantoate 2-reductase